MNHLFKKKGKNAIVVAMLQVKCIWYLLKSSPPINQRILGIRVFKTTPKILRD
jgi:hypothetical protein